jgi:hypothetical protein
MANKTKIVLFGLTLTLAVLACTIPGGSDEGSDTPLSPDILFQDDFSDPSSGWDQVSVMEGETDYVDGAYRIFVNETSYDIWANPGLEFTNTVIEVDATKVGGPDDNDFGIICRYQGLDRFYFFIISSDGYYGIGRVVNGEQELLQNEQMLESAAINQGLATNKLRVECVGDRLSFFANDTLLLEVDDATYSSGDVGLLAGTFDTAGTDIHFDNFIVREP